MLDEKMGKVAKGEKQEKKKEKKRKEKKKKVFPGNGAKICCDVDVAVAQINYPSLKHTR